MTIFNRIIFTAIVILSGGVICLFSFLLAGKSSSGNQMDLKDSTAGLSFKKKSVVHLYFADKENNFLMAEKRVFSHSENPAEIGILIINALINGPDGELMRTIPEGTSLRAFYITEDGTAYVDFSATIKEKHPGGVKSELMTIYSIINSLILNIPEIKSVKILIDGLESNTLSGHIDLQHPFRADMLMIR
jgi:spore germination protein GerM